LKDAVATPKRAASEHLEGLELDKALWHGRTGVSAILKSNASAKVAGAGNQPTQGTLMGVVFPCMSNILGVVLFLRAPWIIGKAGILQGFLLILICCICTFVTSLSLSAIATNGRIKGGGAYYLISRSLGPAVGAGVGLCFYMANSIGAAMYFMGTVEAWETAAPSFQLMTPGDLNNVRVTGFVILAGALVIVGGGIKYVARLGTIFLFTVLAVILCMYLGIFIGPAADSLPYDVDIVDASGIVSTAQFMWSQPSAENFAANWGPAWNDLQRAFPLDKTEYSFIAMMGLWFPAVTGIMAGANRSADLIDPADSIPKGTLFAQGLTSLIYLSFAILYGCSAPRRTLLDDRFFAASSAWPVKDIVVYGVMASTIGAGLTSLTSASKLLSAIASDGTLPILRIFAVSPGKEPRLALLGSGVLCACAITIGELNAVAPLLTMFFLMCYTCVNLSCAILHAAEDPNWRPRFRYYHWSVSLAGALLCIWMMFAMSALVAMVAVLLCMVIFVYATYNSHDVNWGDGFQGVKFQIAKNILASMNLRTHTKNWRPQLLVVTGAWIHSAADGQDEVLHVHETELLTVASQLKGGRGITIVGGVCSSKGNSAFSNGGMFVSGSARQNVLDGQAAMHELLTQHGISGFGRVVYTEDYSDGLLSLVQISGLGAFQPNTVMTAWPRDWAEPGKKGVEARMHFIRLVQVAVVFQKVILCCKTDNWPGPLVRLGGSIDIWWIVGDGGVLLLLPFLLQKHRVWHGCRTRLFVLADLVGNDPQTMQQQCEQFIRDFRLEIEVHVEVIEHPFGRDGSAAASAPVSDADLSSIDLSVCPEHTTFDDEGPEVRNRLRSNSNSSSKGLGHLERWHRANSPMPASLRLSGRAGGRAVPLTVGSVPTTPYGLDRVSFDVEAPRPLEPVGVKPPKPAVRPNEESPSVSEPGHKRFLLKRSVSDPGIGGIAEWNLKNQHHFMTTEEQMNSVAPCSRQEMDLAESLNAVIVQQSASSDLVVTNLPDMPPSESAFGYFQLVDTMMKGLQNCILVRGTSTEVITAFS